ncbi:MAG TPA: hypothetical protein VGR84_09285, partial [Candidatus Acidoferrales bacterium]|nr:hypothetical protein [Candidatus Acidoferrales bacterium]
MKNVNAIYRWVVLAVMLIFALEEINGGRFPSIYDQFWRSWSVVTGRPSWEIAFGLMIVLTAVGVFLKLEVARWAAVVLLSYEGLKGLFLAVSTSDFQRAGREVGDAGAALICAMFLARSG